MLNTFGGKVGCLWLLLAVVLVATAELTPPLPAIVCVSRPSVIPYETLPPPPWFYSLFSFGQIVKGAVVMKLTLLHYLSSLLDNALGDTLSAAAAAHFYGHCFGPFYTRKVTQRALEERNSADSYAIWSLKSAITAIFLLSQDILFLRFSFR